MIVKLSVLLTTVQLFPTVRQACLSFGPILFLISVFTGLISINAGVFRN